MLSSLKKFDHVHEVYHFTVPLNRNGNLLEILTCPSNNRVFCGLELNLEIRLFNNPIFWLTFLLLSLKDIVQLIHHRTVPGPRNLYDGQF